MWVMLVGATTVCQREECPAVGSGTVEGHHWAQSSSSTAWGLVLPTHRPDHCWGLGYFALREMILLFKPVSFKAPG